MLVPTRTVAQKNDPELKAYRKAYYQDFARWSIGVSGGTSFVWGDMRSVAEDKTYFGYGGGLQIGYQISPTIGLTLQGSYFMNEMGNPNKIKGNELLLTTDSKTWHGYNAPAGAMYYKDLYGKVNTITAGLNLDINVNNWFSGNDGLGKRRWTFILSPGVYGQSFDPTIYKLDDDKKFTTKEPDQKLSLGVGGDATLRFKAGYRVDLQLKGQMIWILNKEFDGIESAMVRHQNMSTGLQAGVVFKLGAKKKGDHLLYAKTRKYVQIPVVPVIPEPKIVEKVVEKVVEKIVEVKPTELPYLPSVYFVRGKSNIDQGKYARELDEIVVAMKNIPNARIEILGFCDHTGGKALNDKLSLERAEALKSYLVSKGIEANRIDVKGMGKDMDLKGQDAYSVAARRAQIVRK